MIKLEEFSEPSSVAELVEAYFYQRSSSEQFLFDSKIPVLTDDSFSFDIIGNVQERKGGFRQYILDRLGLIAVDRKIRFDISGERPHANLFKWKVKNDPRSEDPRGEITNHSTKNAIEHTKYQGNHFVKCYAILDDICVAKSKQNVVLKPEHYDN